MVSYAFSKMKSNNFLQLITFSCVSCCRYSDVLTVPFIISAVYLRSVCPVIIFDCRHIREAVIMRCKHSIKTLVLYYAGHKQRGAGTIITAKAPIVTGDGIVLKIHERLPSQLLQEFCQKEKRPGPKYFAEPPGHRYHIAAALFS